MFKKFEENSYIRIIVYILFVVSPLLVLYLIRFFLGHDHEAYNLCKGAIISVFTGVGTSYIFLRLYLFNKKPKIAISDFICKQEFEDNTSFLFKIVNKTKVEIYDLKIEASLLTPFNDPSGRHLRGKSVSFTRSTIDFLQTKNKSDSFNLHAVRIRTDDDIYTIWKNSDSSTYLRFTIIAKHSLSGFNKVFTKEFLHPDSIQMDKKFKNGDDLGVE